MCNLYSITKGQAAIRELARAMEDHAGNLPSLPGVFPDTAAPIVRNGEGGRALAMARWGMPSPVFSLKGRTTDPGVTNIRNTASPHWRRWLGPAHRCLVPFTSFSEYETAPDGKSARCGSRSMRIVRSRSSPGSGRAGRRSERRPRAR